MLNALAITTIKIYQWLPKRRSYPVCKFDPTCSEYAKRCFQRFPFLKAFRLTRERLKRCDSNFPKETDHPPKQ